MIPIRRTNLSAVERTLPLGSVFSLEGTSTIVSFLFGET